MTSSQSDITVKLDDRVRLMSAVLAATRYPEASQRRKPHGTHIHARMTAKHLAHLRDHGAAAGMQHLLDQRAPLEALFSLAMLMEWPELTLESLPRWAPANWDDNLGDFYANADLTAWWRDENPAWQKSVSDTTNVLKNMQLKPFLEPFVGTITENLVFMPNISYPTDQELALRVGNTLVCIVPPRLAWGDSAPWPYDEDPVYVFKSAITQYGRMLLLPLLRAHQDKVDEAAKTPLPVGDQVKALFPAWEDQFITILLSAMVAIYLEDHVSKSEANSYIMMECKVRGTTVLPGVISVLRRYLSEHKAGRYSTFMDFLPVFPKQLRIAARIMTL